MITIIFFISVDNDNYHDKCQIFISFKFKARFLLQSESCRNQTINFPYAEKNAEVIFFVHYQSLLSEASYDPKPLNGSILVFIFTLAFFEQVLDLRSCWIFHCPGMRLYVTVKHCVPLDQDFNGQKQLNKSSCLQKIAFLGTLLNWIQYWICVLIFP